MKETITRLIIVVLFLLITIWPSISKNNEDSYIFVLKWGSLGSEDGQFSEIREIALDSFGYVYAADSGNNRIQKFTSSGDFVTKWGSRGDGNGQLNYPEGIAIDSWGYVYVTDTWNHRIQKFTSSGDFVTKWGSEGSEDGQFYAPWGIGLDKSGYIYITEWRNHRVQKFDSSGDFVTKWGSEGSGDGQFYEPRGIVVDGSGYVYVADEWNNRIQKFTSSGDFVTKWGSLGNGNGQFDYPCGIEIDGSGYVYVGDMFNNRIQKFTSSGDFVTKWGSKGSGDGQFNFPCGIAVDNAGCVFVADTGNHRIQKFASISPPICSIHGVPLIKQCDSPWGVDIYDKSSNERICDLGCCLSAAVMIINYHGASTGFATNPQLLNNWLIDQRDGYYGLMVNHRAVARYARENAVSLYFHGRTDKRDDAILHEYLCEGNPVILFEEPPGHFIVATGEAKLYGTDTWTINDPLFSYSDLLAYENHYRGIRKYSRISASPALFIATYQTVQFQVTDPAGRRTGFDPKSGETIYEIPGATYISEYMTGASGEESPIQYSFESLEPLDGTHMIQLSGSTTDEYVAYFFAYDEASTPSTVMHSGMVPPDSTQTYLAHYSSTIGQKLEVELVVEIDIKPESYSNSIHPRSKEKIPVAILTTDTFDATTVKPTTVRFGKYGIEAAPVYYALEDVDEDGDIDMILHFKIQEIDIQIGDKFASLTGTTFSGQAIKGSDSIKVVKRLKYRRTN